MNTFAIQQIFVDGAARKNVVTVRLLALCPMLAVSVSTSAALTLGLLTTGVMSVAGAVVAAIRTGVPASVRLPVFLVIVATLVAVADIVAAAQAPDMRRQLGIFLPLIVTNCAVLARLELFAARNPPLAAAADGIASGLGMTAALVLLAVVRELTGSGQIAGWQIFPAGSVGIPLALLPAGGFILFGLLLAAARKFNIATG